jgi:hypothetical protein
VSCHLDPHRLAGDPGRRPVGGGVPHHHDGGRSRGARDLGGGTACGTPRLKLCQQPSANIKTQKPWDWPSPKAPWWCQRNPA